MTIQMTVKTLLAAALTAASLAGCGKTPGTGVAVPEATAPSAQPTPAAAQPGPVAALPQTRVTELKPGAAPATFANSALLAVASGQARTDELRLAIGPVSGSGPALAYQTLSAGPPPSAGTDPAVALRRWEERFEKLEPRRRAGYAVQAASPLAVGDRETFWVIQRTSEDSVTDRAVTTRTVYAGQHCYVVVDEQLGTTLDERAREVGAEFDGAIYGTDTRLFGAPHPDAARGGDSKVTILISPAVGDYGRDGTLGYFTLRDMFSPADAPDEPVLAHSNSRFMLYMAANVVSKGRKQDYLGTIAHEFQHLISASHKVFGGARDQEEVWLNEGLSMYAMQANGYGLTSGASVVFRHVEQFLAQPSAYSLTEFERGPEGSAYGAVYLFATYLAERFGEGFLTELVASREIGEANLEARLAARGTSFEQVFRDWVAALLLDGRRVSDDPRFGFQTLDLTGTYGGKKLGGVSVEAVTVPRSGSVRMLPYSADFFALKGAGTYETALPQREGVGGWLIRP